MKMGILIGIVAGVVIVVAGAIIAVNSLGLLSPAPKPSPSIVSLPPLASSSVAAPSPSSPSPSPTQAMPAPSPSTPPVPVPTLKAGIWEFTITGVSGSGLTQTIAAQITNTGATDANNVQAKIEVFSQQQRIQLSGQDFMTEDLGTVKAKTSVTRQVTVTLTLGDGLKVMQNGATFVLTVTSDKGTETLSYDYKPQ